MKLHILTIFAVLIITLPLQAEEESNLWDDFFSFFSSGDNQGENCEDEEENTAEKLAEDIRSEVCPNFLMEQAIKRDSFVMLNNWSISPDKTCGRNNPVNSHFNDSQELETYLKNKEPFSKIDTNPISDCLSHPVHVKVNKSSTTTREKTLPENKHKILITEYYLTQHRLESGLTNTLHDITAIDQLIGKSTLDGIDCKKFQSIPNISNECNSLQQCSPPPADLSQSARETIETMRAIKAIDQQIKKLKGPRGRHANKKNKNKIQELKERKASLQSLYPWVAGRIFQKGYEEEANEEEVTQLIKEQLSDTRERLEKNVNEMKQAVSCIRYNQTCDEVKFDKVMAKTPPIDTKNIFQKNKIRSMSDSEREALSNEQREIFKRDLTAHTYFYEAQCRQQIRENVTEANKELGYFALDVGLTIATVGLGSAAIAGRLAVRAAGNISKAQRLQNLGLMGVDIAFSAPYIKKAINDCDDYMHQLEQTASEETNDVCDKLPVRSKLTSDLKSCLLTASLASLPLAVPAFTVAGRAGYLAMKKARQGGSKSPTTPSDPTNPNTSSSNTHLLPSPQAVTAGTRIARQMDPPRNRLIPRSIQAGVTARNAAGIIGGVAGSSAAAADSDEEDSGIGSGDSGHTDSSNSNDGSTDSSNSNDDSTDSSNNSDNNNSTDEDRDRKKRDKKKDDFDCSKYKGGNPKNRKEMVCYYYARAAQLQEETKNIQQRTQVMNKFKSQVWLGVKENQVPPNFFTNIQKHVQQNKDVTSNYFSSFRLMYDISRIQDQYLNPNDRNRLRQIIQDTDQYMSSPNLDGYSHIQESINILINRLQIPNNNQPFRI